MSSIYKWKNACDQLTAETPASEIRKYARLFGVPPQLWDDPRKVCALITPRVVDFEEGVACDNEAEFTMDGDPIGDLPEFLKYTYIGPNGRRYCYSILDLHAAINYNNKRLDGRFDFTDEIKQDVRDRVEFIQAVIEPRGYMEVIVEAVTNLLPGQELRRKLVNTWSLLDYPKYTVEAMLAANESILDGIYARMLIQAGLVVSREEQNSYASASGEDEKRRVLVDIMHRIVGAPDPDGAGTMRVALGDAINESTPLASGLTLSTLTPPPPPPPDPIWDIPLDPNVRRGLIHPDRIGPSDPVTFDVDRLSVLDPGARREVLDVVVRLGGQVNGLTTQELLDIPGTSPQFMSGVRHLHLLNAQSFDRRRLREIGEIDEDISYERVIQELEVLTDPRTGLRRQDPMFEKINHFLLGNGWLTMNEINEFEMRALSGLWNYLADNEARAELELGLGVQPS